MNFFWVANFNLKFGFEGRKRTTILVSRQASGKLHSPEDLVGIVTAQDLAEIYGMVD
ncbi:hypothetical protein [Streptococcus suis]|uniref:hypothetical protein n=1 Tax=Streptococcus suis TaxID=1307 RepID=UPI00139672DC|nr:hypothetical protein [Streptococcus suis]